MLKKILNSYFIFRLNKRFHFLDVYSIYKKENNQIKKWYVKQMRFFRPETKKTVEGILLMQMVQNYGYNIKMAAAAKVYCEENNLEINFYDPYFTRRIGWIDPIRDLYEKYFKGGLYKAHLSFGKKMIFSCEDIFHDQSQVKSELKRIKKSINTIDDIFRIEIDNIIIGDLVYDTYLRYFKKPTLIDFKDLDLEKIIEISINIFLSFQEILKSYKIKCLFNSYTSYIAHGIVLRICLKNNIPVYIFGLDVGIIKKVEEDAPFNIQSYWVLSENLNLSDEKLNLAKEQLESRFSGKIDSAVSYMRSSSFTERPLNPQIKSDFKINKRNVVIYAHDFYDQPHENRCLQFHDLFQFLNVTLNNLVEIENTTIWVKVHPNSIEDSKELTIELVKKFKVDHFKLLDSSISNLNIVQLKPDLIVTARGTIALEMAYFEIPVVALYDNPFVNFSFTHTCYDLNSFYEIIKGNKMISVNYDKLNLYSFYYQSYIKDFENVNMNLFNKLKSGSLPSFGEEFLVKIRNEKSLIFNNEILNNYKVYFNY